MFWQQKEQDDCKWIDCCDCHNYSRIRCSNCRYYHAIDSGYGYCRAMPEFVVVAWCRVVCSLFSDTRKLET